MIPAPGRPLAGIVFEIGLKPRPQVHSILSPAQTAGVKAVYARRRSAWISRIVSTTDQRRRISSAHTWFG